MTSSLLAIALVAMKVSAAGPSEDFDFSLGTWKVAGARLAHPLSEAAASWMDFEGTSIVRGVRAGFIIVEALEAAGAADDFEVMTVRLYDPHSRQWTLSYSSPHGASGLPRPFSVPTVGTFARGRAELIDVNAFDPGGVRVRNVWFDITPDSYRFEQALSRDGGRTWKACWVARYTRIDVAPSANDIDTEKILRMP